MQTNKDDFTIWILVDSKIVKVTHNENNQVGISTDSCAIYYRYYLHYLKKSETARKIELIYSKIAILQDFSFSP